MLECLVGAILIDFGPPNRPRPEHHSGKNSGRGVPARPGDAPLCSCPSWLRFGSLPDPPGGDCLTSSDTIPGPFWTVPKISDLGKAGQNGLPGQVGLSGWPGQASRRTPPPSQCYYLPLSEGIPT